MTTDVLPNTRNKTYEAQVAEVNKYGGYEVPRALEAAVAILMGYIKAGKYWYGIDPLTYTLCQEKVDGLQMAVSGTGSGSSGPHVSHTYGGAHQARGLGALRKF